MGGVESPRGFSRASARRLPPRPAPQCSTGTNFFWIEDSKAGTTYSWAIKRVPLAGGPSVSLYESKGELSSLAKVGDRLMFFRDEPEPASKKPTGPRRVGFSSRAQPERQVRTHVPSHRWWRGGGARRALRRAIDRC